MDKHVLPNPGQGHETTFAQRRKPLQGPMFMLWRRPRQSLKPGDWRWRRRVVRIMTSSSQLVATLRSLPEDFVSRHLYIGFGGDPRARDVPVPFGVPAILVIDASHQSSVFLFRYDALGDLAGDTWHLSIDEAKEQAESEYGDAVSAWMSLPEGIEPISFGLSLLHDDQ